MSNKLIILYDSKFGNTEKIAKSLARGLEKQGRQVDVNRVNEVNVGKLPEYDFLAFGGPTHSLGLSKPMKDFLEKVKMVDLRGKKAFAFSTKLKAFWAGDAGKVIENEIKERGMSVVIPHSSAIVKGTEGPLEAGAEETFERIGVEIAKLL